MPSAPAARTSPKEGVRPPRLLAAADLAARGALPLERDLVIEADSAEVLPRLPEAAFDCIVVDPPWGTGRTQRGRRLAVARDEKAGDRTGFGGRRYRSTAAGPELAYADPGGDPLGFLLPRLARARELLAAHGTLYVHLDHRVAHPVKLALDELFGAEAFLNELIWAYDYGGKPRDRWPAKHDTILVYVRTPGAHHFDAEAVDREPYMAPGLVTAEQAARGKRPTSVWWHTIVPTSGRERTGYPTQKPEGIVRRMVQASSRPGGWCLDFFAGSGTLGAVCAALGRQYVLVDSNPQAVAVMVERLGAEG